jgi:F-type H+-transporting ATPase subunit gamma
MQKLLELRRRMETVQTSMTVTGTLATVSAAKLSRTRERAERMHAYTEKLREILFDQQAYMAGCGRDLASASPLLRPRDGDRRTLLVVTGDRGMCGAYNLAVERFALEFWERSARRNKHVVFVAKGRKGEAYLRRRNARVAYARGWRREGVTGREVRRLLGVLLDLYLSGATDEVWVLFTRFYSPVRYKPMLLRLLPVEIKARSRPAREPAPVEAAQLERWSYEASFPQVIHDLLMVSLLAQLHDILLESYASEQSARMVTMKEASERAEKTLRDCRLAYNRLHREAITVDLLGAMYAAGVAEEQPTTAISAEVAAAASRASGGEFDAAS